MMPRMSRGRGMVIACSPAMCAGARVSTSVRSAERDRLGDVVGHEHDGLAAEIPQLEQVLLQLRARLRIERAERLVHQDHRRIVDQRADQRGALAHAAGELVRIMVLEAGKPDGADQHVGARARLVVEPPLHGRAETARSARWCARAADCRPASRSRCGRTSPGLSAFGSPTGARFATGSAPRRRSRCRSARSC